MIKQVVFDNVLKELADVLERHKLKPGDAYTVAVHFQSAILLGIFEQRMDIKGLEK